MTPQISVRSDLRVAGAIVLDKDTDELPVGKIGMLAVKGSNLFAYALFNGLETWYPILRNVSKTHLHTQSIPSTVWNVSTGFGNSNYWFQVKNAAGEIEYPMEVEDIDTNTVKLTFSEAISGTAFFVGVNDLDVGEVKASLIKVGSNVVISTSDITIGGVSVLGNVTSTMLDARIAASAATLAPINGSNANDFATKDLVVSGNLAVNGTTVTVNSETVTTKDNTITLNQGEAGAGVTAGSAGLEVDRGSLPKYEILFDEADDLFKVGMVGDLETIASRDYVDAKFASGDTVSAKIFNGAVTCDYATEGSYVAATVTGATTLSITGIPDATKAYGMTFELTNAGANITWPASVVWLGTAPTLRATGVSMVTLVTRNGGTTWFGSAA